MKKLTVTIKDNKYQFFLELIKSMDFVSIVDQNDWYNDLSDNEKKMIQQGIENLENGKIHSHEEVMDLAKKRISELKKSK